MSIQLLEVNNNKHENAIKYKKDSHRLEHEVTQLQEQYDRLSQKFEDGRRPGSKEGKNENIMCPKY